MSVYTGYSPGHAAYTPGLASLTYPAWMATMKPVWKLLAFLSVEIP
jgi:hypothetical protein